MSVLQSTQQDVSDTAPLMSVPDMLSEDLEDPLMCTDPGLEDGKTSTSDLSQMQSMLASGYEDEADSSTELTLSEDLGDVDSLDSGLISGLGAGLDALVPDVGDTGKVQVNLNLPVGAGGLVSVGFEFIGSVERTSSGLTLKVQAGGNVRGSKELDLYVATMEVFAQAKVFGYMESAASSGANTFQQILLGIHHEINAISSEVAGWLFSSEQVKGFTDGMRDGDYVEQGLGLELSAGASLAVDDDKALTEGKVGGTVGTRLTKDGSGLDEDSTRTVSGGLNFIALPFTAAGSLTGKWVDGALDSVKGSVTGDALVDVKDLSAALVGASWFSGLFNSISDCITGASGMLASDDATRQAASLAKFVVGNSGLGVGAEVGTAKALESLAGFEGVKIGHRLTVDVGWTAGKGMSLKISLGRVSKIQFGDAPSDMVYVALENIQELFNVEAKG